MHRYKVCKVGSHQTFWSAVKVRTPKDAIKYIYRDFDIEINTGSADKHTHRVELLYSKKESVTYYNVKVLGVKKKLQKRET